jgi:hypothetical protein
MHPGDDIWRYLWEGHIQNHGFNPYLIAPSASELIPFRLDAFGLDTFGLDAFGLDTSGLDGWSQINHPDHAAIPSEIDRQLAWSGYTYLIVSVVSGRAIDLQAWQLDEREQFQIQPQELKCF